MTSDTPAGVPNSEIRRIEIVDSMPPENERDPNTLYLPENEGIPERDRHLGAFMDRWSSLERMMLLLLWHLLESDYKAAEVLFYSAVNIKTHTDMITGLISLKHPQQASQWRKLAKNFLTLSNNRNHLVHGQWIPEYRVSTDALGRPVVTKTDWISVYMTGDPELNAKAAMQSGKPRTGQHRYPLERIRGKITQTVDLAHAIDAFRKKLFGDRLPAR